MEKHFNSIEYVKGLSEELIDSFKKANKATTPVLDNYFIREDKHNADSIYFIEVPSGNFQYLLHELNKFINRGRSSNILPFNKYIIGSSSLPGTGLICQI